MITKCYNQQYHTTVYRVYEVDDSELSVWLDNNVGIGNWVEYIGFVPLPYRSFAFKDALHETLFTLRFS